MASLMLLVRHSADTHVVAEHADGPGVGLATVQQIVLAVHGDLEITTALGTGTQFKVYLPLCA